MSWLLLTGAGLLEVVWAIALKQAGGFTRFWPSLIGIVSAVVSFVMLSLALKQLPVGTAYAVWVGIGALGVALAGIVALFLLLGARLLHGEFGGSLTVLEDHRHLVVAHIERFEERGLQHQDKAALLNGVEHSARSVVYRLRLVVDLDFREEAERFVIVD